MGDPNNCLMKEIFGTCACEERQQPDPTVHYRAVESLPDAHPGDALCEHIDRTTAGGLLTTDKSAVTCKPCKEYLFS